MQYDVVLEVARLQQTRLDGVVEGHLADGHQGRPGSGPLGALEQLGETLLFGNTSKAVNSVLVTEIRNTS